MALVAMKRPAETALTARPDKRALIATKQPEPRFSELMAPTMKVEGHKGAYTPQGQPLCIARPSCSTRCPVPLLATRRCRPSPPPLALVSLEVVREGWCACPSAGAINSMKFAPHGVHFATGSYDKQIYIWETYGECPHTLTLQGHKNAVLEVHWSPDCAFFILHPSIPHPSIHPSIHRPASCPPRARTPQRYSSVRAPTDLAAVLCCAVLWR
jgi:WD40 repeat protein